MNYCVITTINNPTKAVEKLSSIFDDGLIVVGDKKTPLNWEYENAQFYSETDQRGFEFVSRFYIPTNHYARKNLGYLMAIKNKATIIYDTDDDNIPNENWIVRSQEVEANGSYGKGWYNVYSLVSNNDMWPRGFSLKHLRDFPSLGMKIMRSSPIQQGLSDGEPDVDAIWRLVYGKGNTFSKEKSIYLNRGAWCPFNSQSTWWFPVAYPLMYLPVYATFRMTDIWRSFVAQRCLWELNLGVTFHSPSEVYQDRNEHDLLQDLKSEVPGYVHNDKIVELLSAVELKSGESNICENMKTCYNAIIEEDIINEREIESLNAWIKDYEGIRGNI
jgi:hypothetical protein